MSSLLTEKEMKPYWKWVDGDEINQQQDFNIKGLLEAQDIKTRKAVHEEIKKGLEELQAYESSPALIESITFEEQEWQNFWKGKGVE